MPFNCGFGRVNKSRTGVYSVPEGCFSSAHTTAPLTRMKEDVT